MSESKRRCDYTKCDCEIDPAGAISRGGEAFCTERCAEGRGCWHQGCNCGQFPAEGELPP